MSKDAEKNMAASEAEREDPHVAAAKKLNLLGKGMLGLQKSFLHWGF